MRKFVAFANNLILLFALILEVVSLYFLITVIPLFEPFTETAKQIELIIWGIWFVAVIVSVVLMIAERWCNYHIPYRMTVSNFLIYLPYQI